ncbi:hypothetical protein VTH06DRAFT_7607 [Thermothelomyces fergusii]
MDWIFHVAHLERRVFGINESDDGRIGSGRDDSKGGGTLVNFNPVEGDKDSASLEALGSTFIPVLIYTAVCFLIFFTFRRKCRRVYAPRAIPSMRMPEQPSPELPDGWFNWIKPFFAINDDYIINNCSLDGYLFIRFLQRLSIICLAGVCIVWPVLLPINGTGRNGLAELDSLTIGNVKLSKKLYAHVFAAWCFFGFVLYMICRECIYYVNLRQAYLLSPNIAQRLSSRTVLFTCIPKPYMDEAKLRKLFGDSAKNVWLAKDTSALRALVEDREETAERLQQAEVRLIRLANAARQKFLKKNPGASCSKGCLNQDHEVVSSNASQSQTDPEKGQAIEPQGASALDSESSEKQADPEYTHPYGLDPSLPDVRGSVAALWIPAQARPHHRPLTNFGRRVDTIRWTRLRLKALNKEIWKLRRRFRGGDGPSLNAAFIEFDSQTNAQAGFQILAHHQPLHMSPCYIGLQPDEIIWSALRIRWWERIMRRFLMMGVITTAIVFWSFPAAAVGLVSNVKSLSEMFIFLSWITLLPGPILGVIQGLLPALALSWLMAAVPWMLRGCARVAGVPAQGLVELYVQHAYFFFQVLQVFLITTLTSAASAAVFDAIKNPLHITDMLSENLPKASNFYLSYILIQCLAAGATRLANFGDLFQHELIGKMTANPRRRFYRWRKLRRIHWGSEFPRFTNLGVIAISYSCIAPLILVFAGLGMFFISYVFRYSLIYVCDPGPDTKGLFYPRALMHLMTGLYIAEICLIGLFALKKAFGPLVLMAMFLVFSALVHISLNEAVTPLLNSLPRTLALEKDTGLVAEEEQPGDDTALPTPLQPSSGLAADYYNTADDNSDLDSLPGGIHDDDGENHGLDTDTQLRGIEGGSSLKYQLTEWAKARLKSALDPKNLANGNGNGNGSSRGVAYASGLTRVLTCIKEAITPDPSRPPNAVLTFLHPETYESFRVLQQRVDPGPGPPAASLPRDYAKRAYWPPEMRAPAPRLWLPRDEARVSRQEVAHSAGCVGAASDRACWLVTSRRAWWPAAGGGGRIECDMENSPLWEGGKRYIF